jgi:hypothetical protein
MSDVLDLLPRADRRALARIAEASGASEEAVAAQALRAWLQLVRDVPAALPRDPLGARAQSVARRGS